jgi:hypothetical protein
MRHLHKTDWFKEWASHPKISCVHGRDSLKGQGAAAVWVYVLGGRILNEFQGDSLQIQYNPIHFWGFKP